ncbi:MAG: transporter substrate-binding domain-containing protein [Oscillospiraceae bacterium]|nr:transporter substrate-binding domain-containing protein [Oscillospiraceae bacterium]
MRNNKKLLLRNLLLLVAVLPALSFLFVQSGCRKGLPNEVRSIEDISGKTIAVLSGTPSVRLAEELGTAKYYATGEEIIGGLLAGTVDCAFLEAVVASELISSQSGARILSENLMEYELRFAVPRENLQLLQAINNALATLNSNGVLRALRDKYISGKNYTYESPNNIEARDGTLRLAIPSGGAPPYSFLDENGYYSGLDVEVAKAVCDLLGVGLEIVEVESAELITAVWFGRAEIAAGWLPGDVEEQVHITNPYADSAYVVVVRK